MTAAWWRLIPGNPTVCSTRSIASNSQLVTAWGSSPLRLNRIVRAGARRPDPASSAVAGPET